MQETLSEIHADVARFQAQIDTAREKEANKANAHARQLLAETESEAKANAALLEAQALSDHIAILIEGKVREVGTVEQVRHWGTPGRQFELELDAGAELVSGPYDVLADRTVDGRRKVSVTAKADAGLASDCVALEAKDGRLTARRPMYAGNALGSVQVATDVAVVSVRQTSFEAAAEGGDSPVEDAKVEPPSSDRVEFVADFRVEGLHDPAHALGSFGQLRLRQAVLCKQPFIVKREGFMDPLAKGFAVGEAAAARVAADDQMRKIRLVRIHTFR